MAQALHRVAPQLNRAILAAADWAALIGPDGDVPSPDGAVVGALSSVLDGKVGRIVASSASVWGRLRSLVAPLSAQERLELIQAIAAMELAPDRRKAGGAAGRLAEEQAAWFSLPAPDRARYRGEYVAVREGRVVDHDLDQRSLYLRVRSYYADKPVLILPADWDEAPVYVVRSPSLER